MRNRWYSLVVSVLALTVLVGFDGAAVSADSPAGPPAPTNLAMRVPGATQPLGAGAWTSAAKLQLQFSVQAVSGSVRPQVELEPSNVPFNDQANYSGPAMTGSGTASVSVAGLSNGTTYHWQAQVVGSGGQSSPWVAFSSSRLGKDVGIDRTAPTRPVIRSQTNPRQRRWYHNRVVTLNWSSKDTLSGIRGYSYTVQRRPRAGTPTSIGGHSSVRISSLRDGVWYVSVRAVDRAGNWSPVGHFRVQLDRSPPRLTWIGPSGFTFNPYQGPAIVRFRLNKSASVRLDLYRVGDKRPTTSFRFSHVAGGRITGVAWSGKDRHGNPVRAGYYFFDVRATDRARNLAHWEPAGFRVNPQQPYRTITGQVIYPNGGKIIIISLSRQELFAYDGVRLALRTFVTTGNPSLPTPEGTFSIIGKFSPFEFISPWPPGSPFWYPPSWTNHAMLFQSRGYFIHDAPWRSAYGPGTNGPGQPGSDYGGTHGCVNVPQGPMNFLWAWTPMGTRVEVVP